MSIREPHFLDVTGCVDEVPYSGTHRLVRLLQAVLQAVLCNQGKPGAPKNSTTPWRWHWTGPMHMQFGSRAKTP